MIKLTEEMVIARTRISDLNSVKKLNCWGADLQDVTLLRKMPNVEVLALSVNQIKTLVDFQNCNRLQELYIRKNDIRDLKEICYLKGLTNLKNLWLADNPCSEVEGYRMAVLRALPQLEKLDDVLVKPEEVQEAARIGRDLTLPMKRDEEVITNSHESPSHPPLTKEPEQHESPSRRVSEATFTLPEKANVVAPSPDVIEANQPPTSVDDYTIFQAVSNDENIKRRYSVMSSVSPAQEKPIQHSESVPGSRRSSVAVSAFSPIAENVNPLSMTPSPSMDQIRCPVHHSGGLPESRQSPVDSLSYSAPSYTPSPTAVPPATASAGATPHREYSAVPTDSFSEPRNHYEQQQQRPYRTVQDVTGSFRNSTPGYHHNSGPIGHSYYVGQTPPAPGSERSSPTRSAGKTRNRTSNLLMATLCLINELDYGSLEVVAMAIRNRLEELDD